MSERAAYSRVYYSIVDDPKFATIYDDDHHLAAWLRLLLIADQAHPASAHLPSSVRKASVRALAEAGLIDLAGLRYRIHGLDAERGRRREAATRQRTGRDPTGTQEGPDRDPDGAYTPGRKTKTSKDETRLDEDEQPSARDGLPHLDQEAIRALEERTGHTWSQAGEKQLSEYDRLVGDHGLVAVLGAFDAVRDGKRMTARQLIWPALRVLEPFAQVTVTSDQDAAKEERAATKHNRTMREMWERRILAYRHNGYWEPEWGEPPVLGETKSAPVSA